MNKQDRIVKAQANYDAALAQAQAVPSMYTKRELKRADQARKVAALPLWSRIVPAAVVVGAVLAVVVSCTANASGNSADITRCIEVHKTALAEAGLDRAPTPDEVAACHDPAKRAFILGEE